MVGSNNVDVGTIIDEIRYRHEVIGLLLEKTDLDYLFDEELYKSTINQIVFLKMQKLPETVSENTESFEYDAVNLYQDALESLLTDIEGNDIDLTRATVYKYQHIEGLLNRLVGGLEHESVSDVPHLLNYMYDVVNRTVK